MSRHWSTTDVPARQQFAYWREAVCEAVMNVATEDAAEDDFSGKIACADYGGMRFATFTSTAHRIVRQPSHIARSNSAHFLISLQRSGIGRMQQANQFCELKAGDIGIVDGARPFSVLFPQTVDRAVAVIPSAMLDHRAPWLRDHPIARMRHDPELHPMLRMTIERLAGPACQSVGEAELLADNLCNLVALLTAHNVSDRNAAQERRSDIERMNAFIRRHLNNPDLSPQTLAKYLSVSVRTGLKLQRPPSVAPFWICGSTRRNGHCPIRVRHNFPSPKSPIGLDSTTFRISLKHFGRSSGYLPDDIEQRVCQHSRADVRHKPMGLRPSPSSIHCCC
jgi:hypothetical protein